LVFLHLILPLENRHNNFSQRFPQPGAVGPTDPVISMGAAAEMLGISVSNRRKSGQGGLRFNHGTVTGRRLRCREEIDGIKILNH